MLTSKRLAVVGENLGQAAASNPGDDVVQWLANIYSAMAELCQRIETLEEHYAVPARIKVSDKLLEDTEVIPADKLQEAKQAWERHHSGLNPAAEATPETDPAIVAQALPANLVVTGPQPVPGQPFVETKVKPPRVDPLV